MHSSDSLFAGTEFCLQLMPRSSRLSTAQENACATTGRPCLVLIAHASLFIQLDPGRQTGWTVNGLLSTI